MTDIFHQPPSSPSTSDAASRRRWLAAGREAVFVLAMFGIYFWVRRFTSAELGRAQSNARLVVRWERAVGMFHELGVQHFALRRQWVIDVLDHSYVLAHFPISISLLVVLFLKAPEAYRTIRNWFLIVTAFGLAIHLLFPLAPPRLLDGFGFIDTLDRFGPDIYPADVTTSTANQLAAMPSLHFTWALLVAIAVVRVWRSRRAWLAFVHPSMTLFAIVATGNHYLMDALVGAVLVLIALLLRPLRRPQRLIQQRSPPLDQDPATQPSVTDNGRGSEMPTIEPSTASAATLRTVPGSSTGQANPMGRSATSAPRRKDVVAPSQDQIGPSSGKP